MKITKRQLRQIIREAIENENPGHIVDAETGEIYVDWKDPSRNRGGKPFSGMRADFEIWLAENPKYVEAPPAIPAEWDKTDDFFVEPKARR
jgi:hypothetical protein